jgi:hypothetical protein
MAEATNLLSSSSYPTLGDLHIIFPAIINILSEELKTNNNTMLIKSQIAQRMYTKLNNYWTNMKDSCYVSVVLDPNVKLSSFNEETTSKVRKFRVIFIQNMWVNNLILT